MRELDKSEQRELSQLILAAEAGDGAAQAKLGWWHQCGLYGLERSDEIALEWYRKSAAQNHPKGQHFLGMYYKETLGELEQASELFHCSAEQGGVDSQYTLALMYFSGEGVEKNIEQGLFWLVKAAKQPGDGRYSSIQSQTFLARLYQKGQYVEQSNEKAFKWKLQAAQQNSPFSDSAQFGVAKMYRDGVGTKKNYEQARDWFEKLAEDECSEAYRDALKQLGKLYEKGGPGLEQNLELSYIWHKKYAAHIGGNDEYLSDISIPDEIKQKVDAKNN